MTYNNLPLTDYYKELKSMPPPTIQLIKDLSRLTHRNEMSVRNWLLGKNRPEINTQILIADYFGTDVKTLFPPIK